MRPRTDVQPDWASLAWLRHAIEAKQYADRITRLADSLPTDTPREQLAVLHLREAAAHAVTAADDMTALA